MTPSLINQAWASAVGSVMLTCAAFALCLDKRTRPAGIAVLIISAVIVGQLWYDILIKAGMIR
jgi:hypothetical protein